MGAIKPIFNQHVQPIDLIHREHDYCYVETLKLRLARYDSSNKSNIKIQVETVGEDTLIEIKDCVPWLDQTINNIVVNFPHVSVDGETYGSLTSKSETDDVNVQNDKCNTESQVEKTNLIMEFQQSGTTPLEYCLL